MILQKNYPLKLKISISKIVFQILHFCNLFKYITFVIVFMHALNLFPLFNIIDNIALNSNLLIN